MNHGNIITKENYKEYKEKERNGDIVKYHKQHKKNRER